MRTRIKFCGMMRPEDAHLASDAGADAVGMIFHPPAPRNIGVAAAREIVSAIGPFVTPVGVFVDASTDQICLVASAVGLRIVQLHGHEPPSHVAALASAGLRVIKAIRVDRNLESQLDLWRQVAAGNDALVAVVLETADSPGGSGISNDWATLARCRETGQLAGLRAIAAGGLDPLSVADVVRAIHPWAVDVSSGVESALGVKSPEKVRAFVAAVRAADVA